MNSYDKEPYHKNRTIFFVVSSGYQGFDRTFFLFKRWLSLSCHGIIRINRQTRVRLQDGKTTSHCWWVVSDYLPVFIQVKKRLILLELVLDLKMAFQDNFSSYQHSVMIVKMSFIPEYQKLSSGADNSMFSYTFSLQISVNSHPPIFTM